MESPTSHDRKVRAVQLSTSTAGSLFNWSHQNIFQLDVSVDEALTVQEPDPLHHIEGDL